MPKVKKVLRMSPATPKQVEERRAKKKKRDAEKKKAKERVREPVMEPDIFIDLRKKSNKRGERTFDKERAFKTKKLKL